MMEVDQGFIGSVPADVMESRSVVRSCLTCSKAKAKCVRTSRLDVCDRCARLKKECSSKEPVIRRRKTLKSSRAAQLAKLESKIEHLVNTLSSQPRPLGPIGHPSPPLSQRSTDGSVHRPLASEVLGSLCVDMPEDRPADGATTTDVSPSSQMSATAGGLPSPMMSPEDRRAYNTLGVTLNEAEVLLDRYKRLMASSLPFVCLPPAVTAQELWSKKPLLLHAITTVTYFHDLPRQQSMVKGMMRDITERILMNNEKHIGIVQGLLVFVAWYHPHIFWGQQVTNLLHLAIAMTIDLGIDRAPGQCQTDFKAATTKAWHGPGMISRVLTMEEYRATAGVYYLTSMLASSFKKIDALAYTKFLDESLRLLEDTREYESDLLLVQIVRLQHLAEDTHTAETPNAPTQMYVKAFEADLAQLRRSDPYPDNSNILLRLQYLTAEILVWELSLNELQESKTKPLRSHIDDLYHCIDAIKHFTDVYFSIPANEYLILPFSVFGQFAHAFIVLTKIASLEIDGWDIKTLHLSLDFASVIERAAVFFDSACKSAPDGQQVNNECFGKWAHRIRWMKQVYEAKFSPSNNNLAIPAPNTQPIDHGQMFKDIVREAASGRHDPQNQSTPQQPTPPDDILSADFFNYLDNDFWNSFPPEYDLGFPEMPQNAISPGYGTVGG